MRISVDVIITTNKKRRENVDSTYIGELRDLRLDGMVRGFEEQLSSAECNALTFEERAWAAG